MNGRAVLAWNLRRLRVERGLSQDRLAADAGLDRAYYGGLERQQENPSLAVLERLAATLVVPLAILFSEPEDGTEAPQNLTRGRKTTRDR